MGLFSYKAVSRDDQVDFSESEYYEFYRKYAGARIRDDFYKAMIHINYVQLQYLRDIEEEIKDLRNELYEIKMNLAKNK